MKKAFSHYCCEILKSVKTELLCFSITGLFGNPSNSYHRILPKVAEIYLELPSKIFLTPHVLRFSAFYHRARPMRSELTGMAREMGTSLQLERAGQNMTLSGA